MQLHPLQFGKHTNSTGHARGHRVQFSGKQSFAPHAKPNDEKQHAELVKNTQKWVSQTFYGEMLKQMRNSPLKSKLFDGGNGGEAFQQMFDNHLADDMSKSSGKKLVDAIVNRIEAQKAYGQSSQKLPEHRKLPPNISRATMGRIGHLL
jgi:Rod binding domain-containing protein